MQLDEKFFQEELRCGYLVSEKIKKVWAAELNLLAYFDEICRRNHLRYFVDYGTLLGAVRHQGFIPWDDDIDVVMFRKDYEKLKEIAQEAVAFPYFFQNSYTDTMIWAFAKLRDSRTTAIEFPDFPSSFNQGIFIDIFPMDDIPDGISMMPQIERMQREMWLCIVDPETALRMAESGRDTALGSELIKDLLRQQVRERMKLFEDFNLAQAETSSRVSFITRYFSGSPSLLRSWFSDVVWLPFENTKVPAPVGYQELLKCRYGDYTVPAEYPNDHAGIFFDPDKPYSDYMD